jgi:succinate-semialdehyde dehydrogenase/glutarate-semialdehyde dehydrogenase
MRMFEIVRIAGSSAVFFRVLDRGDAVPIATINPATAETVRTFEPLGSTELDGRLQHAAETFKTYRRVPLATRAEAMRRAADILDNEKDIFARVMTMEMGKLLQAGRDEAAKCAWGCRFYAEHGERLLADEPVATGASRSYIRYQPLGPILAVMPWNFPFWQVFRFAAPALMAGNVVLLKHASNVPQCALLIEDVIRRAGFPDGAFQALLIDSGQVSPVLDDPRVAGVTLTGSEGAGRQVASRAGGQLKKSVLELGGSDPFIVMPSANLAAAVETAVKARIVNSGQSCIAGKRFIVAEPIADAFEQAFTARMAGLRVGDPLDETTEVGPLASEQVLADLHDQVRRSVEAGARVLTGGAPLDRPGHYYQPTVLTDIPREAPAYREELFGPVASLFRAPDIDAAIHLANDTTFGLGCSVWTNDPDDRERFVDEIEAGQVFVNGMVVSDPRLPFGGIKHSGYGRELSEYGIREFVNIKTVWIS